MVLERGYGVPGGGVGGLPPDEEQLSGQRTSHETPAQMVCAIEESRGRSSGDSLFQCFEDRTENETHSISNMTKMSEGLINLADLTDVDVRRSTTDCTSWG